MVLRLNKAIYGLKQASRMCRIKLNDVLVNKLHLKCIYSDSSIFVYKRDSLFVILPVFVDDGPLEILRSIALHRHQSVAQSLTVVLLCGRPHFLVPDSYIS